MATIHDEIDIWLAADLHDELSDNERSDLHGHLLDCAACRRTHQEAKAMNKILEETLAEEKADPAFEQRMLTGFRNRVPEKSGFVKLLGDLMRLRAAQITAVAAALLGLVQVGRIITGEPVTAPPARERYAQVEARPALWRDQVESRLDYPRASPSRLRRHRPRPDQNFMKRPKQMSQRLLPPRMHRQKPAR
jgi:anti-sigma factor RsiW